MKKSKPKQRTNWKQRALHCEEVIGVQNQLAKAAEVRMSRYIYSAAEAIKRAESAEKYNALLLEERADTVQCSYCEGKVNRCDADHISICDSRKCLDRYYAAVGAVVKAGPGPNANPPTH